MGELARASPPSTILFTTVALFRAKVVRRLDSGGYRGVVSEVVERFYSVVGFADPGSVIASDCTLKAG